MAKRRYYGRNFISRTNSIVIINGVVVSGGMNSVMASDNVISRKVDSSKPFRRVSNRSSIDVEYTEVDSADDIEIEVQAPDNMIDYIKVVTTFKNLDICLMPGINFSWTNSCPRVIVKGHLVTSFSNTGSGSLYIKGTPAFDTPPSFGLECGGSGNIDAAKYKVKVDSASVSLTGSGEFVAGQIEGNFIDVSVCGSGDLSLERIKCKSLSASVNGSGDLELSGKADTVRLAVAGSGDIAASGLKAKEGSARVAGSGDIHCCVKSLSEHCHGSGDVYNIT